MTDLRQKKAQNSSAKQAQYQQYNHMRRYLYNSGLD